MSGIDVRQYAKCDGITDDGPVIQSLANKATAGTYLDFPAGHTCRIDQGLMINSTIGLVDANLDFSHAPIGTTALTIVGMANDYTNGSIRWERVKLAGNKTGGGLLIAANHISLNQFTIHDFETNVQLGPNGYSITLNEPFLYNATTAFNVPQGPNAGEQIVINGGSLFNSQWGILGGGAGMVLVGTSIDGMSQQSILWWGGGFRAYGIHIENYASPAGPIIENAGGNDYCFMDFEGLEVYQNTGSATLKLIKNPASNATINFIGYTKLSGNIQ